VRPARHHAVVALGSNLGDREGHLRFALRRLGRVERTSQVWETEPIGPAGQGPYLNLVAAVATDLRALELLHRCQTIEAEAGRQRVVRWGARTLDVDLLFVDHLVLHTPELELPHPRIGERRFVLEPLEEVAPERCPPGWRERLPPASVVPLGRLPGW
jgi:2-amino-4-hydroxy-6-hydroxymethyldihydropteridine diphosphokinase